jgi:hypothetical protein
MKFIKYIPIICLFILGLSSCEDVIDVDLTKVPPKVVIEGFITDNAGPYMVQISRTTDFYEPNIFPPGENAIVKIMDDQGNEEILTETSPGNYETSMLQGVRGVTYTLAVELEGIVYTASCKIPEQQISLDSITINFEEESLFFDEGYYATAYYNDPPDVDNYYRLQVLVNGEVYYFVDKDDEESVPERDINFWLTSDKFTDGNLQDYEFPHNLKVGDTLDVSLEHLDRSTYDYYRTLVDVIDGGGVAPSNPITNIDNGALGYFGAFSVTGNRVVVRE